MAFSDPLDFIKSLSPSRLKKLAGEKLSDIVLREAGRSRRRLDDLQQRYPTAGPRELAQRMVDDKKNLAGMIGGVSGVFGVLSVPADLVVIGWLQIVLLVDIATLYKVNLKPERARRELLDLYGYANGIGSMRRAGPKVLGSVAGLLLRRGGLGMLGRAVPLVAAPITAYLNSVHLQRVGEEALRHYQGFDKAHEKTQKASGA
ncbi:MAG: hypothetical protein HYZ28_11805 [Myxococcales bacterium]|nr:hypothetical protein [Myxococcales bacterium]